MDPACHLKPGQRCCMGWDIIRGFINCGGGRSECVSGEVRREQWRCTSDASCQMNGVCDVTTGVCNCDAQWLGSNCSRYQSPVPATRAVLNHHATRTHPQTKSLVLNQHATRTHPQTKSRVKPRGLLGDGGRHEHVGRQSRAGSEHRQVARILRRND